MANRMTRPVHFAFEANVTHIFARVTFGATGAPTLDTKNSKGVCNISRTSAGLYVLTLGSQFTPVKRLDPYNKLLSIKHTFDTTATSTAPAAPSMYIAGNAIATATSASLTIQFNAAGTATDPASGEVVYLEIATCNSTAI